LDTSNQGGYDSSLHKQYKVDKKRVINALKWLKIHHSGYHDIEIVPDNFWFKEDEVDMSKDATVIELQKETKVRDEKVSEAHTPIMEEDEENVIEVCTMHANETEILPKGEQAEKLRRSWKLLMLPTRAPKYWNFLQSILSQFGNSSRLFAQTANNCLQTYNEICLITCFSVNMMHQNGFG